MSTQAKPRQLFVNLPVENLDRTVAFFTALGFGFNPQFTDENATCMIVNDGTSVMLLVESYFATFTKKPLADAHAAGVVAAAGIGGGAADRTRFDVGDGHLGAGDGLAAIVGDQAAHTGRGALRKGGRGGECDDEAKAELGQAKTTGLVHRINLGTGVMWRSWLTRRAEPPGGVGSEGRARGSHGPRGVRGG